VGSAVPNEFVPLQTHNYAVKMWIAIVTGRVIRACSVPKCVCGRGSAPYPLTALSTLPYALYLHLGGLLYESGERGGWDEN